MKNIDIQYISVTFADVELNAKIVALGKEVFPSMATVEEIHTLTDGYADCQGEVIAMLKKEELVGFAFLLHYLNACFLNYFAIKPKIKWFDPDDINRRMDCLLHGDLGEKDCSKILEDVQVMWNMQYFKNHPDLFNPLAND